MIRCLFGVLRYALADAIEAFWRRINTRGDR